MTETLTLRGACPTYAEHDNDVAKRAAQDAADAIAAEKNGVAAHLRELAASPERAAREEGIHAASVGDRLREAESAAYAANVAAQSARIELEKADEALEACGRAAEEALAKIAGKRLKAITERQVKALGELEQARADEEALREEFRNAIRPAAHSQRSDESYFPRPVAA